MSAKRAKKAARPMTHAAYDAFIERLERMWKAFNALSDERQQVVMLFAEDLRRASKKPRR